MRLRLPVTVAALALLLVAPASSRADEGSGPDCVVKGKGVIDKTVTIYDAREGGIALASFATQEVTLEVSDFPADPSGRAKVKTGKGGASLRIEGWMDAAKVPLSAKSELPVVAEHVWIGRGQVVKLKGASPGKITVETTLSSTQQKLKSKTACSGVAVGNVLGDEVEVPKGAKKWVLKSSSLDLFDSAGGATVFTLDVLTPETGLLLFSTDGQGAYMHVRHYGGVVVDAWAKTSDLKLFPKGEMLDELAGPGMVTIAPAKLKVDGATKEGKAAKDTPVRSSANDKGKQIGTLEEGADVIVIDTMAGWSRVFPKTLELIPPDGKDFWVKADAITIK